MQHDPQRYHFQKVQSQDVSLFFRQLSTLISAGIALSQAFYILRDTFVNRPILRIIIKIHQHIDAGNTFFSALQTFPTVFNPFYCGLVEVGELCGNLDHILNIIAIHQENVTFFKRKLKQSMIYPACVLLISIALSVFLLCYIVPIFQALYQSYQWELPWVTRSLIKLSRCLMKEETLTIIGILFILLIFSRLAYLKNKECHRLLTPIVHRLLLNIPFFSKLYRLQIMARFAAGLAITQTSGLPLIKALHSLSSLLMNTIYIQAVEKIIHRLNKGLSLHIALQKTELFPTLFIQMVAIGEQSGTLDTLLHKVAELYEGQFNAHVLQLTTLIEPLMMVLMGLGVGGLMIALYLPMFNMGGLF